MSYYFSFRWMKFAVLALLGWLVLALPILLILALTGLVKYQAFTLIAAIPSAIWYVRRYNRDKAEFDVARR